VAKISNDEMARTKNNTRAVFWISGFVISHSPPPSPMPTADPGHGALLRLGRPFRPFYRCRPVLAKLSIAAATATPNPTVRQPVFAAPKHCVKRIQCYVVEDEGAKAAPKPKAAGSKRPAPMGPALVSNAPADHRMKKKSAG
jgi:hypothetical protein